MGAGAQIAKVAAFLVAVASAAPARAESLTTLVPRLIEESGWLKRHTPGTPQERPRKKIEPTMPSGWLGDSFHFSLLARDWTEAFSITDGHPLVFDRMRLIRSSRMAVTRFSLESGRFTPFVEISGGQWRVDADLLPGLPRDTEFAMQLGTGFQLRLAKRCALAWDIEKTSVFREQRTLLPVTNVYASFVGVNAEF